MHPLINTATARHSSAPRGRRGSRRCDSCRRRRLRAASNMLIRPSAEPAVYLLQLIAYKSKPERDREIYVKYPRDAILICDRLAAASFRIGPFVSLIFVSLFAELMYLLYRTAVWCVYLNVFGCETAVSCDYLSFILYCCAVRYSLHVLLIDLSHRDGNISPSTDANFVIRTKIQFNDRNFLLQNKTKI